MPEVAAWAIADEERDIIDLDVRDDMVGLTLNSPYGDEAFQLLTVAQARALARDLNAAARVAGGKR